MFYKFLCFRARATSPALLRPGQGWTWKGLALRTGGADTLPWLRGLSPLLGCCGLNSFYDSPSQRLLSPGLCSAPFSCPSLCPMCAPTIPEAAQTTTQPKGTWRFEKHCLDHAFQSVCDKGPAFFFKTNISNCRRPLRLWNSIKMNS